jgi:hypothetical protein
LRQSILLLWIVVLIIILKTPSKTVIDYILLFFAIGNIASLNGTAISNRAVDTAMLPPLSDRCKEAARDPARKIEAIRIYREETGLGLREAKAAVEAFISNESHS